MLTLIAPHALQRQVPLVLAIPHEQDRQGRQCLVFFSVWMFRSTSLEIHASSQYHCQDANPSLLLAMQKATSLSSSCIASQLVQQAWPTECSCGRAIAKSEGFSIIPAKGRFNQMPGEAKVSSLPQYRLWTSVSTPPSTPTVPSQQPLGAYMPIFRIKGESGEVSAYFLKPCMAAIRVQASERKKCDVRLRLLDGRSSG